MEINLERFSVKGSRNLLWTQEGGAERLRGEIFINLTGIKSGLPPYILNTRERYREERHRRKKYVKI